MSYPVQVTDSSRAVCHWSFLGLQTFKVPHHTPYKHQPAHTQETRIDISKQDHDDRLNG